MYFPGTHLLYLTGIYLPDTHAIHFTYLALKLFNSRTCHSHSFTYLALAVFAYLALITISNGSAEASVAPMASAQIIFMDVSVFSPWSRI